MCEKEEKETVSEAHQLGHAELFCIHGGHCLYIKILHGSYLLCIYK
jgi:hypothetical protein